MSIVRDGVTLSRVGVMFDEEVVERSEWVGRGADGFPVQEGKMIEVVGKNLIIRRALPTRAGVYPSIGWWFATCAWHPTAFTRELLWSRVGSLAAVLS